jgi:hypothetical protein
MTFDDLLLLILTDEIARRDNTAADLRASEARLDPAMRLETWDKTSKVSVGRRRDVHPDRAGMVVPGRVARPLLQTDCRMGNECRQRP